MSTSNNVNPGRSKGAGRDLQDEDVVSSDNEAALTQAKLPAAPQGGKPSSSDPATGAAKATR